MFWCGVYNLYLTYTEMYIVVLTKFSLYNNLLIQYVTARKFNKLLLLLLLLCYYKFTSSVSGSWQVINSIIFKWIYKVGNANTIIQGKPWFSHR